MIVQSITSNYECNIRRKFAVIENSPFNHSSKTMRRPPSTRQPEQHGAVETL